jgi:hypothetical protein
MDLLLISSGRAFLIFSFAALLAIGPSRVQAVADQLPPMSFNGEPEAAWLEQGRRMRLTKEFAFADASGYIWRVPAGIVVDGASIPKILWSWVGGPFEGRYRNASILHDYFDHKESHPWRRTHALFFSASIAGGEDLIKSLQMLRAIVFFGTSWNEPDIQKMDDNLYKIYLNHTSYLANKYGMGFDALFDYAMVCLIEFPGESSLNKLLTLPSALRGFDCHGKHFQALRKVICDDLLEYSLRVECKREEETFAWPWKEYSSGLPPAQKYMIIYDLLWFPKATVVPLGSQ